jgi:hypothetical protein
MIELHDEVQVDMPGEKKKVFDWAFKNIEIIQDNQVDVSKLMEEQG